jgi:glycosyltransferase involved in cell wall biosynthesis
MEKNKLLSIVIPAYNSASTIKSCIESILVSCNIDNTEVIVINDGSKDETQQIVESFCNDYTNIRLINNSNHGVSYSRNLGITISRGEWICFIDSDDTITPNFLKDFYKGANGVSFDLFFGNVERSELNGNIYIEYQFPTITVDTKTAIEKYSLLISGDPHAKIFNREIIEKNNIRFDEEISYGEDRLFFDNFLLYCSNIAFDGEVCYKYLRNPNGLSYKRFSYHSELRWFKSLSETLNNLSKHFYIDKQTARLKYSSLRFLEQLVSENNFKKYHYILSTFKDYEIENIISDLHLLLHIPNSVDINPGSYLIYIVFKIRIIIKHFIWKIK